MTPQIGEPAPYICYACANGRHSDCKEEACECSHRAQPSRPAAPDSPEDRETMRRDFERGVYEREKVESETPETDKEEVELEMARGIMEERDVNELPILKKKIVRSTFARSLERRLSLAQARIAELEKALREFVRLDEESELCATDGGELVSALHDAKVALKSRA